MNHTYDYSRAMTRTYPAESLKIIRRKELAKLLGVSESTIDRRIKDGLLPEPLRGPGGYSVGWFTAELDNWIKNRSESR